jgi:hypothetical protein
LPALHAPRPRLPARSKRVLCCAVLCCAVPRAPVPPPWDRAASLLKTLSTSAWDSSNGGTELASVERGDSPRTATRCTLSFGRCCSASEARGSVRCTPAHPQGICPAQAHSVRERLQRAVGLVNAPSWTQLSVTCLCTRVSM